MKEFNSLDKFAHHLEKTYLLYDKYEAEAAMFVGEVLEHEAKDKIGHLQEGGGPFPAWAELADSTKADKEKQGYVFNSDYNPLYRTGETRKSIHHVFFKAGRSLYLGSDSQILAWMEEGTRNMPARSTIGLVMFQAYPLINYVFGTMLQQWAAGEKMSLRRRVYGSV